MGNEQRAPRDGDLIALLNERNGRATRVEMRDGSALTVFNFAWGYDMGAEFAHVTTNISPPIDGGTTDHFRTSDVAHVSDVGDGMVLLLARNDLAVHPSGG